MAQSKSSTRVCNSCGHRLITVRLDTGHIIELDTQRQCYVMTGRELDGLKVYVESRAYVRHYDDCKEVASPLADGKK